MKHIITWLSAFAICALLSVQVQAGPIEYVQDAYLNHDLTYGEFFNSNRMVCVNKRWDSWQSGNKTIVQFSCTLPRMNANIQALAGAKVKPTEYMKKNPGCTDWAGVNWITQFHIDQNGRVRRGFADVVVLYKDGKAAGVGEASYRNPLIEPIDWWPDLRSGKRFDLDMTLILVGFGYDKNHLEATLELWTTLLDDVYKQAYQKQ